MYIYISEILYPLTIDRCGFPYFHIKNACPSRLFLQPSTARLSQGTSQIHDPVHRSFEPAKKSRMQLMCGCFLNFAEHTYIIYILHISIIYKLHIYHINVYIYIYWFYMDLNSDATAFHLCWKCTVLSLRKSWDLTFSFLLATNLEALKPVIQGYPRRIDGPGILLQPWQPGPIPKTLDVCGFLNFLHRRSELKTNIHGISFISFMLRSPMYSRGMLDIAGHSCKGKDRP